MGRKGARKVGITMAERVRAVEGGVPRQIRKHAFLVPWTAPAAAPDDAVSITGSAATGPAVPRPGYKSARRVCNQNGLDIIYSVKGVGFVDTGERWRVSGDAMSTAQVTLAEALGQPLPDEVSRWTSVRKTGWTRGGDLHLACPRCNRSVDWFDWWHPDAVKVKNSYVVWCPVDGVVNRDLAGTRDRPLADLLAARRVLDSRVWAGEVDRDKPYWIYAIDLLDAAGEVYVGKSIYSPEDRRRQHEEGERAARVFKKGARPGDLRTDLPPLPVLTSNRSALAAERWVAAHFEYRGLKVHGDGRR